MRTITVKGTGNVSARPDYIILSLNIETLSKTYDRAMSEAAERIERLQGAAVCVGYRKEDLKITSFDVQTRYENVKDRQGNYKREFVGYACSYRLKLLPSRCYVTFCRGAQGWNCEVVQGVGKMEKKSTPNGLTVQAL